MSLRRAMVPELTSVERLVLRQTAPALSVFLLVFLAMVAITPACSGPNKRTRVLQQTVAAVNAARDGFLVWDRHHQLAILDRASSREEAIAKREEYLVKWRLVMESFTVAYQALIVAATQTDTLSYQAALAASADLLDTLKKLMGGG